MKSFAETARCPECHNLTLVFIKNFYTCQECKKAFKFEFLKAWNDGYAAAELREKQFKLKDDPYNRIFGIVPVKA